VVTSMEPVDYAGISSRLQQRKEQPGCLYCCEQVGLKDLALFFFGVVDKPLSDICADIVDQDIH
jgi:hypothetical protein